MKDEILGDLPIVRHAEEDGYLRLLLRLVRNVVVTSEYRVLDHFCFENPLDVFYLVKDVKVWYCEVEFEAR